MTVPVAGMAVEPATAQATEASMRAIRFPRYGSPDVLELIDVDVPAPADDQVLVRVRAASVNALDWHRLTARPHLVRLSDGWRRPKDPRLGADVAGIVEAVGKDVTRFGPGDEVFGMTTGSFAEHVVVAEHGLVRKPIGATFIQAGAVGVAGITALQGLRDRGRLQPGQRVLVNGAGGGVGSFAVQIARGLGGRVTAVTRTDSLERVRSLGAEAVVDHTTTDATRLAERFDLVFDAGGNGSLLAWRRVIAAGGRMVICGAGHGDWLGPVLRPTFGVVLSRLDRRTYVPFLAKRDLADLEQLGAWLADGTLVPGIERTYTLAEAADAIRHVQSGAARGKVVITT
jgi:NADPH:quinone reductase-like Zn-dependent oxidoreductase